MKKKKYWFSVPAEDDGWLWFVCCQCPYLLRMCIATKEIIVEAKLPIATTGNYLATDFVALVKSGNKVIMFSHWGLRQILEYDCETKIFTKIIVPVDDDLRMYYANYDYICDTSDCFFVIGSRGGTIIKVDKKTGDYSFLRKWFDIARKRNISYEQLGFGKAIVKDKRLYIPCRQENALIVVDYETDEAEILQVGNYKNGWYSISYADNRFWLVPIDKPVLICWDYKNNKTKLIDLTKYIRTSLEDKVTGCFCDVVKIKGDLYILPCRSDFLLKYNLEKETLGVVRKEDVRLGLYCGAYENEKGIWSSVTSEGKTKIVHISKSDGNIVDIPLELIAEAKENDSDTADWYALKQYFF